MEVSIRIRPTTTEARGRGLSLRIARCNVQKMGFGLWRGLLGQQLWCVNRADTGIFIVANWR
jgi:hypothetical protein